MAGSDSRFSATQFREGIRFAMNMALPTEEEERITFQWDTERTFEQTDSDGAPFVWSAGQVTSTDTIDDLQVTCVVKIQNPASRRMDGTSLGIMDVTNAEVTILDEEWAEVMEHGGRVPDRALIGGNQYLVRLVGPPVGLFEVTIYRLYLQAMDES
jgi:hypothetical protein